MPIPIVNKMTIPIETNISKSMRNNVSRLISSFMHKKIRISLHVLLAIVKPEIHQLIIGSMIKADISVDSSDDDEDEV